MTCKLLFLLFFFFNAIISIKLSSKALERVTNTIRVMLSLDKEFSISSYYFEFPKYELQVLKSSNLIVLNPNEILVTQDENDTSKFIAHNITTEQLLFCKLNYLNQDNKFNFDFAIEMHYSQIIFKSNESDLKSNYLFLDDLKNDFYKIEPVSGIANLDYFKLLNKGIKAKYKYNNEKIEINNMYETISEKSFIFFSKKIKLIGDSFNLLTYDLFNILNSLKLTNISCSENTIKNYNVVYIYFTDIKTVIEYLNAKTLNRGLLIDEIEFTGYYKSNLFKNEVSFSCFTSYNKGSVLYPNYFYINIDKDGIKGDAFIEHPEQKDAIYNAIENDVISYLNDVILKNYYNSFSN